MQKFRALGLRRLGAPPPDPQTAPQLRISGYAPEQTYYKLRNRGGLFRISYLPIISLKSLFISPPAIIFLYKLYTK